MEENVKDIENNVKTLENNSQESKEKKKDLKRYWIELGEKYGWIAEVKRSAKAELLKKAI